MMRLLCLLLVSRAWADVPHGARLLDLTGPPALSPDGSTLVFEWNQDLWTAPSHGGEAKQIMNTPHREAYPKFLPDGSRIVFSSDRNGTLQIHSVKPDGSDLKQHGFHSEASVLEAVSPDGSRALASGPRERFGYQQEQLVELSLDPDQAGEQLVFQQPAHSAGYSPDGASILFCRYGEHLHRQGYHGARAAQIWRFDRTERSFHPLVKNHFENRSPVQRDRLWWLENRHGCANLVSRSSSGEIIEHSSFRGVGISSFHLNPTASRAIIRRGAALMELDLTKSSEPKILPIWTREDTGSQAIDRRVYGHASSATRDPRGTGWVVSIAGELWRIAAPGSLPERLSTSPQAETEPVFSADGTTLFFLQDDGLNATVRRSGFSNGTLSDLETLASSPGSKQRLRLSNDGSRLAWIERGTDLATYDLAGKSLITVLPGWDTPTFDLSPDGNWICAAVEDADANRDLWLVSAKNHQPPVNLTRHPGFEGSPKWSPDGRWIAFTGRDIGGESELRLIDLGASFLESPMAETALQNAGDKAEVLSTLGIEPSRVIWQADSKQLWFQSRNRRTEKLFSVSLDGDMQTAAERRGIPIGRGNNGTLLWQVEGTLEQWNPASGSQKWPISLTVERPRSEVLRLGFRRIWRTLGERFHDESMHGTDWPAVLEELENGAANAVDSRHFDRYVDLLYGRLNASHLAFKRRPWPGEPKTPRVKEHSGHPGFSLGPDNLRIARIWPDSPAAKLDKPPAPGDLLLEVNGRKLTAPTDLTDLLRGKANQDIRMKLQRADGSDSTLTIRCLTYPKFRELSHRAGLAAQQETASAILESSALFQVPDMSRASLDRLSLGIHRLPDTCRGIILDLRGNSGGREADRMLNLFCQPDHATTRPRNGPQGYPLDRRPSIAWNGPLVVLCDQDTYSNAEIFCHAIRFTGRAPLVGTPTAGGVISAVKTTIPDLGELQVPFRTWLGNPDGKNLDLNGAEPTHRFELSPADLEQGLDPQLESAVRLLRETLQAE